MTQPAPDEVKVRGPKNNATTINNNQYKAGTLRTATLHWLSSSLTIGSVVIVVGARLFVVVGTRLFVVVGALLFVVVATLLFVIIAIIVVAIIAATIIAATIIVAIFSIVIAALVEIRVLLGARASFFEPGGRPERLLQPGVRTHRSLEHNDRCFVALEVILAVEVGAVFLLTIFLPLPALLPEFTLFLLLVFLPSQGLRVGNPR